MRILVIDDHAVVREGIRHILAEIPDAEICDAGSREDALLLYDAFVPNVVTLEIGYDDKDGIVVLQQLAAERRTARVLVFTALPGAGNVARALAAGAAGYLTKSASPAEFFVAVNAVAKGDRYIESALAGDLLYFAPLMPTLDQDLSHRQRDVLRLLGEGKSISEIAAVYGVAYKTAATFCARLKSKLELNTADLIRLSVQGARK